MGYHLVKCVLTHGSVPSGPKCRANLASDMKQSELVLEALIHETNGLTLGEIRERTGLAASSARTLLWDLKRDGLITVVGGTRGRFRYGVTGAGRKAAAGSISSAAKLALKLLLLGVPAADMLDQPQPSRRPEARHLVVQFARWLAAHRASLLAEGRQGLGEELEEAAADFLYERGAIDALAGMHSEPGR